MARTVDLATQATRRETFIDVAMRLVQTRGYEQMTIQDVLDATGASRGGLYHYFTSKQELLEAVVERMLDGMVAELTPHATDTTLTISQRLDAVFSASARWKAARRELVIALLPVFLSDDNVLLREKIRRGQVKRVVPLLATILDGPGLSQDTTEATARVLMALIQGFGDDSLELMLSRRAGTASLDAVRHTVAAYTRALERVLDLPAGSITLADEATIGLWFG